MAGVGFQRRGIDRDRAALQEAGRHEARLDPRKHRPMRLHIDQPPGARNRRVIRGGVLESEAHEAPHRQRIRRAPGDAALRIEAFEVPHQQQAEVATWRHTFRATGITAYLLNGGTLERAQAIAAHESPRTTKLYDRTDDEVTVEDIEKIGI